MQSKNIPGISLDYLQDRNGSLSMILEIPDVKEKNIIYYQIEMISENFSQLICDMSISCMENSLSIIYNINGKSSLTNLYEQKTIGKHELLVIIRNIIRIILRAERYFLSTYNFLLSQEAIFVNPESLEAALIYVPIELNGDFSSKKSSDKKVLEDLKDIVHYFNIENDEALNIFKSYPSNETYDPGNATLVSVLNRLNNFSLQVKSEKVRQDISDMDKQLVIRKEIIDGGIKDREKIPMKQISLDKVFQKLKSILINSIKINDKINKKMWLVLAALISIQFTAILIMVILKEPIRAINPGNTALTYGLFGMILAGINTLIIRRIVN